MSLKTLSRLLQKAVPSGHVTYKGSLKIDKMYCQIHPKMWSRNLAVSSRSHHRDTGIWNNAIGQKTSLQGSLLPYQIPPIYTQKAHLADAAPRDHPPIPRKLPITDPEKGDLVYVGPMTKLVKHVKLFSFSTSLLLAASFPTMLFKTEMSAVIFGTIFGTGSVIMLVTPILIHYMAKNYVTHMYYNESKDKFNSTTYSFFLQPKNLEFSPKEAVILYDESIVKNVQVQEIPLFVEERGFLKDEHYIKFMKFDEPFDLMSEAEKAKKYLEEKRRSEEETKDNEEKMRGTG